jgi:stage II sporulation protein P
MRKPRRGKRFIITTLRGRGVSIVFFLLITALLFAIIVSTPFGSVILRLVRGMAQVLFKLQTPQGILQETVYSNIKTEEYTSFWMEEIPIVGAANDKLNILKKWDSVQIITDEYLLESINPPFTSKTPPEGMLPIEKITIKPNSSAGYNTYEGIYLNNKTSYKVDIPSVLCHPLKLPYKKGEKQVLIVHTHGTESFSPEGTEAYDPNINDRSHNADESIIAVGKVIAQELEAQGIGVIHETKIHDYPSFSGSYDNAAATIEQHLKNTPSINVVLDIHRDGIVSDNGTKYAPITIFNDEEYAQVMLVMGTNEGGLKHDNWEDNLNLAFRLQQNMNSDVPSLARPVDLRKQRFNEHMTTGSLLMEVGSCGNSLNQAKRSGKVVAQCLARILKRGY